MTARTRQAGPLLKASMILILLLVLAAAGGVARAAASSSPSPGEKLTLHIGMVQEPDNLNPFIGIQGIDYMFWHMNYDFLVGFDSKTWSRGPSSRPSGRSPRTARSGPSPSARGPRGRTASRSRRATSRSPSTTSSTTSS